MTNPQPFIEKQVEIAFKALDPRDWTDRDLEQHEIPHFKEAIRTILENHTQHLKAQLEARLPKETNRDLPIDDGLYTRNDMDNERDSILHATKEIINQVLK